MKLHKSQTKDIEVLSEIVDQRNIPVLCYGLKTDANGNLFEGTTKLMAIADEITEIPHPCKCGEKATHHIRRVDEQVDTGGQSISVEKGNVTYESVCRKCWKLLTGRSR